ncbi:MAG: hypothetical protein AB2A00_38070 [Myxococcota bacterium]
MKPSSLSGKRVTAGALMALAFTGCVPLRGDSGSSTSNQGGGPGAGSNTTSKSINCDIPLTTSVTPQSGRQHHCAIDIGSSNLKLVVDSIVPGDRLSLRGERFCKVQLNLGDHVRNPISGSNPPAYPPVPETAVDELVEFTRILVDQCAADGGEVVGGVATSWGRRAPNANDILATLRGATGVEASVIPGGLEGRYGYWAATRGRPGMIAMDAGSSSFQISYWPLGGTDVLPRSWELGYRQAAADHFAKKNDTSAFVHATYDSARDSFLDALATAFVDATPPDAASPNDTSAAFVTTLQNDIQAQRVERAIIALGEDGSSLLLRQGKLNPGGNWVDRATYLGLMEQLKRERQVDDNYGIITGSVTLADAMAMQAMFADRTTFDALRNNTEAWNAYGPKATGGPVLVEFLMRTLGVERLVLVPQEMPDGFILDKLGLTNPN